MDDDEDTGGAGGAPRKSLWRSVSWSARSSPTAATTTTSNKPPPVKSRASLPPLPPLSISRRPLLHAWPLPGSDDSGHWPPPPPPHPSSSSSTLLPPSTPSSSLDCSRVTEHIYLGSDAVARDRDALRRRGITHVLNCVGFTCPEYFKGEDITYKTLWLRDSPAEDITSLLYDVFDYLEEVRLGGRVLVHCNRGASRSAALVVAYLMWRQSLSFDAALRLVRSARGAADPNLGFTSQLLQCQRRVLSSPSFAAAVRAYRMAPHSPYDPLHLVPKAVDRPGPADLDSRGAFVVYSPAAVAEVEIIYVWVGRECEPAMADSAAASGRQVIKYEGARGPILTVEEGSEPSGFWEALGETTPDQGGDQTVVMAGKRRVEAYDLDFEIYKRALRGGVVPLLPPSSETGAATRIPAKESGWSRVRQTFLGNSLRSSDDEEMMDDKVEAVVAEPFGSPGSCTPSSSDSCTLSTFSPASSSSGWYNSSPGSDSNYPSLLPLSPPPLPLPLPLPLSPQPSLPSLAQRRGGNAPSPVLLHLADDDRVLGADDRVKDWPFSPYPLGGEEGMVDVDEQARSDPNGICASEPVLYRWPSLEKVKMLHPGVLNSESVLLLLAPNLSSEKPEARNLYVWVGRQSHSRYDVDSGGNGGRSMGEDRNACLEKIARDFLDQMGLPDIPIQIIREEEEPEQFLNHLFTFHQTKENQT